MILHSENIDDIKTYTRIVSLVPSQTELLYDLGLDEEVIGITKFCVHPNVWHKTKTRLGGTKNLKINIIQKLKPDLIIANKEENIREQIEQLAKTFDVFVTDVRNINDALKMIKNVGMLTGQASSAVRIANSIQSTFKKLFEKISSKEKIKTAYVIWRNPYMVAGGDTFISDMMQYCGMQNIYSNMKRYPEINIEDLKDKCELLLLSSEPYPFKEKHIRELQSQIPAVKIVLADGEMFSWYGSRLLKAAKYFETFYKTIVPIK
ncbi:MAG TPA: helical backbone metal receptor [Ginsengibacter sp.]|nr:helical backbone metal receptor [Ginsengibacter sp.]